MKSMRQHCDSLLDTAMERIANDNSEESINFLNFSKNYHYADPGRVSLGTLEWGGDQISILRVYIGRILNY
jgi:hypothetical protein